MFKNKYPREYLVSYVYKVPAGYGYSNAVFSVYEGKINIQEASDWIKENTGYTDIVLLSIFENK